MAYDHDFIVVGCGVFGLSTSIELAKKGYRVLALDSHEIPSPWSAANDLNKIVRIEYPDKLTARLAIEASELWQTSPVYKHCFVKTGRLMLSPTDTGSNRTAYEKKSLETLSRLGSSQRIEPLTTREEVGKLVPQFKDNTLPATLSASFNHDCGMGLSDKALIAAYEEAKRVGVMFKLGIDGDVTKIASHSVEVKSGNSYGADKILLAAGAASVFLAPLDQQLRPWAFFVAHITLTPEQYEKYKDIPIFFSAEYGYFFPPDKDSRKIKIAITTCDGFAVANDKFTSREIRVPRYQTEQPRYTVPAQHFKDIKTLLRMVVPELADHPVHDFKVCWIADTVTNKFLIDECPYLKNVFVATGDSGHAFKFLPNIGKYVVQRMEGTLDEELQSIWSWNSAPVFPDKPISRQSRPHYNLEDIDFVPKL